MRPMLAYLFLLSSQLALASVCPNHYQIKAVAKFTSIEYSSESAEMTFQVPFNGQKRVLTFVLPAHPPFTRDVSPHYVSNSTPWDRGHVNWGTTEHYKTDYATVLLNYVAFRAAYDYDGNVDCVYLSILENNYLYGHLWTKLS